MSDREKIEASLIEKGLIGENSLPVLARMAEDPGEEYFIELKKELHRLFELMEGERLIDRKVAAALFGLSHIAYTNYEAAIRHGKQFRDTLIDPDMIDIEMAVDSIFNGEWVTL